MSKIGTYKVNGIPLRDKLTAGNALFVHSVDGVNEITSYGERPDRPLATLDYAINNSVSGDTIYVMERHAETINTTAALIPDVPKLTIEGVGEECNRPVISLSTSGANKTRVGITGAGTRISNITFRASSTAIGSSSVGIAIGAADVTIENCRFDQTSSKTYFANVLEILPKMHRARFHNNKIIHFGTTTQMAKGIDLSGTGITDNLEISNNDMVGCFTNAVIVGSTDHTARFMMIENNKMFNNSTINTDLIIKYPSSANINGGGGGMIVNNLMISGTTGASTDLVVAPYLRGARNIVLNSSGILFHAAGYRST